MADLLLQLVIDIFIAIFRFCLTVVAVIVGIKIAGKKYPAASPAPAPAVHHKAAPKKSKKTSTSKTEEEDPGLGA
ncbi:hypothetical protein B9Z55_011201 [Caenorhabditis nigoni]|uniref:Uncharacterized protein n=1 Tax=Caenorhabditis nigoni TaxID=1611254 RepID=A0A2G5UJ41_9PELO|nr:hypothetical protein B9Z55_011201 [Caenorhabditis nigoni]